MRFGVAIDLHAPASAAADVSWPVVRDQVLLAERLGFDVVVLPDHLAYRAAGEGDYTVPDEPVGVREAMTIAAAAAAVTERVVIAHSVVNAVYRTPVMLAHLATTIADVAGGRYSLGIGVGNTFDYDQLGVEHDHRVARFVEAVEILDGMLHRGSADLAGEYWSAHRAELPLRDDRLPVPLVVAAGGPRTLAVVARFADAWNGFVPTDPDGARLAELVDGLDTACRDVGRAPSDVARTLDVVLDPLDRMEARARSLATLRSFERFDIDEVRIYPLSDATPAGRATAIEATRALLDEV